MKLHLNRMDFKDLISIASNNSGIDVDIIEKDYYVTLMLMELSAKQEHVKAYFKGGTCLYKVYAPMRRFSEDIDLSVCIKGETRSHAKKLLEHAGKDYQSLEYAPTDCENDNRKGSITQVYKYQSVFDVPEDLLQRFERVKIEATSFTVSEPTEKNMVESLLMQSLPVSIKEAVLKEYEMFSFPIENISLEWIFCDKLLAAEFYVERKAYFDVAKHIYDIYTMTKTDRIKQLLGKMDEFIKMLSYKRIEETIRIGSDLYDKRFSDFLLFDTLENDSALEKVFGYMQEKYVFQEQYMVSYAKVLDMMAGLQGILENLDEQEQRLLHSDEFVAMAREYNPDFSPEKLNREFFMKKHHSR